MQWLNVCHRCTRVLRRRWWIVAISVSAALLAAFTFSLLQRPRYQSRVEIVIEPDQPNLDLAQSARMLLTTYMTIADSNDWAQQVINELALPMTPERLRRDVRFTAEDDRMVIALEVEGYDADQTIAVARTWANRLVRWREQQNQLQSEGSRVLAYLRDQPRCQQVWPRTSTLLIAGSIFGLSIGAAIIFLLEWAETGIVRSAAELEHEFGLIVMGAIPRSERLRPRAKRRIYRET
ncbi:MAG: hypothetical protein GX620_04155 [Chloroflexi bacterium]|nr:hypothetical protein [Chloroflexota bacterium]